MSEISHNLRYFQRKKQCNCCHFVIFKVGAGLMTETELKRIEYMIRVMSSHQVINRSAGKDSNENQMGLLYGRIG